ncbi:MAG: glutamine-hydrolyzing carbamoyl-phosphate synthase small subunit [Longimicrobiaceae bacterium]
MSASAVLLLEDGRGFPGKPLGTSGTAFGEVVFNTSMTGYQEVLTDPSYTGQLVVMTYPLIGNYGTSGEDDESDRPRVAGFVVRELPALYSSWRAGASLEHYLQEHGVVAIQGVDSRALTRHLRSRGAMRGVIAPEGADKELLLEKILAQPRMEGLDLAYAASTSVRYQVPAEREQRFRVAAFDLGVKSRSLELLAGRGCEVTVLPYGTRAEEVSELAPDGLFVSNGPGDPASVSSAVEAIRRLGARGVPVFGICLGHQLLARAYGGSTYKLLYGHRGGNHPVRRLTDGAVEITAQNHGFAVRGDREVVPGATSLRVTHLNLNDGTVEGVEHREEPVFAVQYHPEAAPGPQDSHYLFDSFISRMEGA